MLYTVYKTINLINNKFYIGVHKTKNINDLYYGSGNAIKNAIKKYGKENFKKEILFVFDNLEDAYHKEKELVNQLLIESKNCYNLREGGVGPVINNIKSHKEYSSKGGKAGQKSLRTKQIANPLFFEKCKKSISSSVKEHFKINGHNWVGKKHKEISKKKISDKLKLVSKGKNNSQYGTCWIYNLELQQNKKIQKIELAEWIANGWQKGRKMKFN